MPGPDIARQIREGLEQAARATGQGARLEGILHHKTQPADSNTYPPPEATETDYPCVCLFGQFDRREAAAGMMDGVTVKILIAADGLPVAPSVRDSLSLKGVRYTLDGGEPIRPGGFDLLHIVYGKSSGQVENG